MKSIEHIQWLLHRPPIVLVTGILACPFFTVKADAQATDQLNTIEVTDTVSPYIDGKEPASHVVVIHRKQFENRTTDLAELLSQQASTQVQQSGGSGSYSQIQIRGSAAKNTMIFLDGVPLNDGNTNTVDLSQIPLEQIESIQIYKSGIPLQMAGNYTGSAIYIQTRQTGLEQATDQARVAAEVGSFGYRKLNLFHAGQHDKWQHLISLSAQQSDNDFSFTNDNGTDFNPYDDETEKRQNAQTSNNSGLVKFGFTLHPKHRLNLQWQGVDQTQHLPDRLNSKNNNAQLQTQRQQLGLNWQQLARSQSLWQGQTHFYFVHDQQHYLDTESRIGLGKQDNLTLQRKWRLSQFFEHPFDFQGVLSELAFNLSYQFEDYQTENRIQDGQMTQRNRDTLLAGTEWRIHSGNWHLTPAIQWQKLTDSVPDQSDRDDETNSDDTTGQISLKWQPSPYWDVFANIASRIRQPSFAEKYSDQGYVIGNPDLQKESTLHQELGLNWQLSLAQQQLSGYISGFYDDSDNKIIRTYDARGIGRSENLSHAQVGGIEMQLGWQTHFGLDINANASWQTSNTQSDYSAFDQQQVPNLPSHQFNLDLKQTLGNWSPFYHFGFIEGAFYDRANLLPIKTKRLHDLGLGYSFSHGTITAEAKNLLDENYEDFNGYPTPGRHYSLKATFNF